MEEDKELALRKRWRAGMASMALQGMIASGRYTGEGGACTHNSIPKIAKRAVAFADALLEELDK